MANDQKVKDAREREMAFHEKVYEDMKDKSKCKDKKETVEEVPEQPREAASSSSRDGNAVVGRGREETDQESSKRRRFEKDLEGEVNVPGTKRVREDQREREEVEEECDEEVDSDGDLELGWVEFAMNIDGVDMVKDINVEEVFNEEVDSTFMEAFDDVTGLQLDVGKLKGARSEEIRYIESHGIWEVVPVSKCWDNLKKGPTSGRWVDVQKGDEVGTWGGTSNLKGRGPRRKYLHRCLHWRQRKYYSVWPHPRKANRGRRKFFLSTSRKRI